MRAARAVTGGYVYRGAGIPALRGCYVYGDYVSRRIWAAWPARGRWSNRLLLAPHPGVASISTFGEDEAGELYLADYGNGRIWRLAAPEGAKGKR